MMRMIALLSALAAVAVLLGFVPAEFAFAGISMPDLASIIAAIGMAYSATFLSEA